MYDNYNGEKITPACCIERHDFVGTNRDSHDKSHFFKALCQSYKRYLNAILTIFYKLYTKSEIQYTLKKTIVIGNNVCIMP